MVDNTKESWTNKKIDKFIVLNNILGQGAFGVVYKGFFTNDESKLVACKAIDIQHISKSGKVLELIKREISILQKLTKSKYITQLYDVARTPNNLYMFLELCIDGNLRDYISNKKYLSESEATLFFKHICQGFQELNKNQIIHRDIKPANILLHNGVAKISDFGFSRVIETGCDIPGYFSRLGSPLYMSPQILEDEAFSAKCDVWSVGIVLYEMLYGETPWTGMSQVQLLRNIKKQPLKFPEDPPRSQDIKSLIARMLQLSEQDRIGWDKIFGLDLLKNKSTEQQNQNKQNCLKQEQFVEMNKEYVERNLVQGYLDKNISEYSQQSYNSSDQQGSGQFSQTQSHNNNSSMNVSKIIQDQAVKEKVRKSILKVNEYILYERNIGFFFNYAIQKLIQAFNNGKLRVQPDLYFRLIFAIAKNQNIALKKIHDLLQEKTVKFCLQENWDRYKKSEEFQKTHQIVRTDILHAQKFFLELIKKTKENVDQEIQKKKYQLQQQQQSDSQKSSIQNLEKELQILEKYQDIIDEKFENNSKFKEVYKETLLQILSILVPIVYNNNAEKDILIISKYILVCKNPYVDFNTEQIDFNLFYEKIERNSEEQLRNIVLNQMKDVQKSIESNIAQQKQNSNDKTPSDANNNHKNGQK